MPRPNSASSNRIILPLENGLRVADVLLHLSTDGKQFDFETVIPASCKITTPDVGAVMGCSMARGTKEWSAFFRRALTLLCKFRPATRPWARVVDRHLRPIEW
jgi:hypothetical protein